MAETSGGAFAPDDRPLPGSRYGRKARSPVSQRWMAIALTALVVALGFAVARLGYQRFEGNAVEGETVSITISVTRKDPANQVVCIVRARSRDGAETGRREILVGASQAKTVQVTTTVKSYKRPFVGDIYGCGVDVPGYLLGAS